MIVIRRVFPGEAERLSQIAISAKRHWRYPEHWIESWLPQLTFDADYFVQNESWAAEIGQNPVGFYTLLDREGFAWLENLWVEPQRIGQSIGRQLFLHAVSLARQRGYKILRLLADPNAAGFYEKMGMHEIGEHRSDVDGQPRQLPIMEMDV